VSPGAKKVNDNAEAEFGKRIRGGRERFRVSRETKRCRARTVRGLGFVIKDGYRIECDFVIKAERYCRAC
jgi:hypothetical protein